MELQLKEGQIVTGIYKTGKYIGEITVIRPAHYIIKVLAVVKHPLQGDLHNPKQADVPVFHERRALAHQEQVNIPKAYVKPYEGSVPSYEESLKQVLSEEMHALENEENEWAKKALGALRSLEKDYFKS